MLQYQFIVWHQFKWETEYLLLFFLYAMFFSFKFGSSRGTHSQWNKYTFSQMGPKHSLLKVSPKNNFFMSKLVNYLKIQLYKFNLRKYNTEITISQFLSICKHKINKINFPIRDKSTWYFPIPLPGPFPKMVTKYWYVRTTV